MKIEPPRVLVAFLALAIGACSGNGAAGAGQEPDPSPSDRDAPTSDVRGDVDSTQNTADGAAKEPDALEWGVAPPDGDSDTPDSATAADAAVDALEAGVEAADLSQADAAGADADAASDVPAEAPGETVTAVHPPHHCAYFLTGEVDLEGTDADGDGVPNGWDHCPNNPYDGLDSDRDGVGNRSDPDLDGDGLLNEDDGDRDGDGAEDAVEVASGTDPSDPSSIPGLPRLDADQGVWNPVPGWYKTDLHVHCGYSHDSDSALDTYPPACQTAGLDFMTITDHDVFDAPFDPAWVQDTCLMMPGMEWGGSGGHANQWGIRTFNDAVPDTPEQTRRSWRLARLQGGVQSLNHYGADKESLDQLFAAAPDLYDALDVIEVWNSPWPFNTTANLPAIELWERLLNEGRHLGAVGGGDSHTPFLTLGSPTTVVWAESLSVPGILHGLRKGRTYITQADAMVTTGRPELDFRVDADMDGVFEAMLGDEAPSGPLALRIAVKNAKGPVVLVRNATVLKTFSGHASGDDVVYETSDNAPPHAWYRVEMYESALPFSAMRLFSSAIYVGD